MRSPAARRGRVVAVLVLAILVPFRDAVVPAMTAAVEDVFTEAGT